MFSELEEISKIISFRQEENSVTPMLNFDFLTAIALLRKMTRHSEQTGET